MAVISQKNSAEARQADDTPRPVPFWRAIVIGALLIPLSTYFGNYAYVVVQALLWGQTSLLRGPIFLLFLVALTNLGVRRIFRRAGLQPSEMVVIYAMIAVSVCVSGYGMIQWLVNMLPAGTFFEKSFNHYDRFLYLFPSVLTPHDPRVVHDFFIGHTSMYRADILRAWAVPVVLWSLFIFGLCWTTLCLSCLVRRQWVEEERLNFPLVYLPLEMAQAGAGRTPFFRNRLMWAGFVLAGLLESLNYLNYFYPNLPSLQIKPHHWEDSVTTAPWNSLGMFATAFYPFAIGIAFLLSLEVSFSCWFFYLVTKAENILAAALNLSGGGVGRGAYATAPFLYEQGVGAFVALACFLLWKARKPLLLAGRSVWNRAAEAEVRDLESPLSPRVALLGGLLGIACLTLFVTVLGLPLWLSLLFWVVYFLFLLVLTRITAEAGAGWAWGPQAVHSALLDMVGVRGVNASGLTAFGYLSWFEVEFRDSPMPHQLEALKMGQDTGVLSRQLLWALLIAAGLSTVAAFWTYLHIYYEFGAASAKVRPALAAVGPNMLRQIDHWLNSPKGPDSGALTGMIGGGIVVLALSFLRQTFVWWPFHPIGYVLAGTQSMDYMWCPFFSGWLLKLVTLRYGGIRIYRQALPFFLGLILGDYIVPTLWGLWGMALRTQVYTAFPH